MSSLGHLRSGNMRVLQLLIVPSSLEHEHPDAGVLCQPPSNHTSCCASASCMSVPYLIESGSYDDSPTDYEVKTCRVVQKRAHVVTNAPGEGSLVLRHLY